MLLWCYLLLGLSVIFDLSQALRFHSYYSDGMVLQRSRPDKRIGSSVWGYGEVGEEPTASIGCISFGKEGPEVENITTTPYKIGEGTWRIDFPPQSAGARCDIEVHMAGNTISLANIVYGDVWLCSGQSNMEQAMQDIKDAEIEVETSLPYHDVRFTVMNNVLTNPTEDPDLDMAVAVPWTNAESNIEGFSNMSAICYLYGRNIYDQTGVPQGLISSDVGGSPIEAWSSSSALESCDVPSAPEWMCGSEKKNFCNSALWNGMINPLKRNSLAGFLWYQGETNGGYGDFVEWGPYNADIYNCTFPALINSWRQEFAANSDTDPEAPFGFVQLAAWRPASLLASFPVIRWHQTADQGTVPNPAMPNVFMASALDTYDSQEGYPGNLHPRYKQVVASRLATAGLSIAYDFPVPHSGPYPASVERLGDMLVVTYNQEVSYNTQETSGFFVCNEHCDDVGAMYLDNWVEINKGSAQQLSSTEIAIIAEPPSTWIAYCWRETPVQEYLGLPIYATDEWALPSPPWKKIIL